MPTRILLVEDNPGDAIIFREKLNASDLDYELTHTKRLKEGLEKLLEATFDILLVDLSLPDAQGLEAVTKIREAAPDRPLIVLTGLDDARAAAEAKKQGAVDYLVKWYVDSVSLARYIRYAIAQYQMYEPGMGDDTGSRPVSPQASAKRERSESAAQVVEGKVVRPPAARNAAPSAANGATGDTSAPAPDAVRHALAQADAALLIVTGERHVVFASDAARAWVPDATYPWPLEEGSRRIPRKGRPLQQHASRTTWNGKEALFVTLALAPDDQPQPTRSPQAPSTSEADPTLLHTSEAVLAFVEHTERASAWMADVLRSALDLHRISSGDVDAQLGDVDALELAQQVVREQRPLAMSLGLPLRATSTRKKVIAYADRNLVIALLNRLVIDAVQTAGPDGIEVRVEVDRSTSVVEVEWMESRRAQEPAVEACSRLGRELVQRMAAVTGGESAHERNDGGRHVVTVRLPSRSVE